MAKLVKDERGMNAAGCESLFQLVEERAEKAERANSAVCVTRSSLAVGGSNGLTNAWLHHCPPQVL